MQDMQKYVAYLITWIESESGWGCRPDGISLHSTKEKAEQYVRDYWSRMPKNVPSEYSRPDGASELVEINEKLATDLVDTGSARYWQNSLKALLGAS